MDPCLLPKTGTPSARSRLIAKCLWGVIFAVAALGIVYGVVIYTAISGIGSSMAQRDCALALWQEVSEMPEQTNSVTREEFAARLKERLEAADKAGVSFDVEVTASGDSPLFDRHDAITVTATSASGKSRLITSWNSSKGSVWSTTDDQDGRKLLASLWRDFGSR